MENHTFKVGDIVRLKGGGPVMTITNIVDMGDDFAGVQAVCTWFDKNDVEQSGTYGIAALEATESGPALA